jgi:hypothetical protein
MFRIAACSQLLKSIAITTLVAGLAAAQALTSAGPNRPATVPANFVITPFGYFNPGCVTHLAPGDVVRQDENAIQHANGSYDNIAACASPHYTVDGEPINGDQPAVKPPTISHAWIEYASTTTSSSFGYMNVTWNDPRRQARTTARPSTSSPAWRTSTML